MTGQRLLAFTMVMVLCIPLCLSIVDNDMDGYCDVESIGCKSDYCLNTPLGEIVDYYGCSCSQKTAATCQGEWCCQSSYDECGESCSDIDFTAVCTQGAGSKCGLYRDCLPDGCYSTQETYWYDFPESGHDYCENGRCINYSCEPVVENLTNGSNCDYEYCQKTYGDGFSCHSSDYFESECAGSGTVINGSSCMMLAGGTGMCVSCDSGCEDTDQGINYMEYGAVIKNNTAFPDSCINPNSSLEYYCDIYGNVQKTYINCPDYSKACENGRCVDSGVVMYGVQCSDVDSCGPGLSCATGPGGAGKVCCNPDECYNGAGCVNSGDRADYLGTTYLCRSGFWEEMLSLGCYISDSGCPGVSLISMGNLADSHVSMPGTNPDHHYTLCCDPAHVSLESSGDYIFSLSNPPDDAHVSVFEGSAFPNKIYLKPDAGSVQCSVREACNSDEECLFSLSDDIGDAHIADCSSQYFKKRLCCGLYPDASDRAPPMVSAEYDGDAVHVVTNEWAGCKLQVAGTEIPCTSSDCQEHDLPGKIFGREFVSCTDSDNNTNSDNMIGSCYDGTPMDSCTAEKPKYCSLGTIAEDCRKCGCPAEAPHCDDDGTCRSLECLEGTPTIGTSMTEYLLNLGNPIIRETAEKALQEYADFIHVDKDSLNTADEYIEAVSYYVDRRMTYVHDDSQPVRVLGITVGSDDDHTQSALETIRSSGGRCNNLYCGDCEDFSILRLALLRALGVKWDCAFGADHFEGSGGHSYDIVIYEGAYRIMDYRFIGEYFTYRWNEHITDNVWNDYLGMFWLNSGNQKQYAYNYPEESVNYPDKCRTSAWSYDTYYTDICP